MIDYTLWAVAEEEEEGGVGTFSFLCLLADSIIINAVALLPFFRYSLSYVFVSILPDSSLLLSIYCIAL